MNDDLEERLRSLRPAALPQDLMRGLRSAEPTSRMQRSWPWKAAWHGDLRRSRVLAGAGLLAASVLIFANISPLRQRRSDSTGRLPTAHQAAAFAVLPQEHAAASTDHGRGVPFDFTGFRSGPFPTYAVLSSDPDARSAGGFHLEVPAGPVRFDCGYTLVRNDFNNYPFGKLNLNVSDSF